MPNPFAGMLNTLSSFANPRQQDVGYEFYKPTNTMQNRFVGLLDSMPQPEKVGFWRKLGSSLGAMNQENPAQNAMLTANAPYFNRLREWEMMMPFAQQAADNERLTNTQGLNYNNQLRTQSLAERKLDETERNNRVKNEIAQGELARKEKLAELAIWKQQNPNQQFRVVNGELFALDPATGEAVSTGIKGMTKLEELQFQANAAMQRVNAQQEGANARNAATIAGANARNEATIAGANARNEATIEGANARNAATNAARGTGGSGSPLVNKKSRAIDVANRNPEWAEFINADGTVKPAKEASSGIFGMGSSQGFSKEDRDKVVDYIEGKTNVIPIRGEGSVTPIRNTPGLPDVSKGTVEARTSGGKILMTSPNGQQGYVPVGQVEAAIAQGYKRAQ